MQYLTIGTAGHIDHGKTSLVQVLTGIDTDRLKEEKLRGITIELGFAHLDLPGAPPAGIVDVPGHEKFVHHMVAGAAGIDLVLLVIAADEGIMPQTREHLDICRLLGVRKGLVVLTKTDLIEPEWLEMVQDEVIKFIAGTFLEGSPVIPVSSVNRQGLPELLEAIRTLMEKTPPRPVTTLPRLPIDRVFTMKGFGTVVTGTLISGIFSVGETVEILPSGIQSRVRGLQVHGQAVETATTGQRTAVNLQGVEKTSLQRGDTLTRPGVFESSYLMDARLLLLPSAPRPLANRTRIRLHLGTSEILARVIVLGQEELSPGETGLVQLHLESAGVALPRDRFVIRSYSPIVTLGGGEMVDTHPPKHRRFSSTAVSNLEVLASGNIQDSAALLLHEAALRGLGARELSRRLNLDEEQALTTLHDISREGIAMEVPGAPPLFLHAASIKIFDERSLELLEKFHRQSPLKAGLPKEELKSKLPPAAAKVFPFLLERLQQKEKVVVEKDLVRLSGHRIRLRSDQEEAKTQVENYFRRAGLQPPIPDVISRELNLDPKSLSEAVSLLLAEKRLVKIQEDITIHKDSLSQLRDKVAAFLAAHGQMAMPDFKELSGVTRKYAVPILEYFDRSGLTIRIGDHRVLRKTT